LGVAKDKDGALILPLRIASCEGASLNLVPIDFVITSCMAIADAARQDGVYNIVNPEPTSLEDFVEWSSSSQSVRGVRTVPPGEFEAHPKTSLDKTFEKFVGAYAPYLSDVRTFDCRKSAEILEKAGIACPKFDRPLLERCIEYGMEVDWGKRLFGDGSPK